jgi:hypothetical protein
MMSRPLREREMMSRLLREREMIEQPAERER